MPKNKTIGLTALFLAITPFILWFIGYFPAIHQYFTILIIVAILCGIAAIILGILYFIRRGKNETS